MVFQNYALFPHMTRARERRLRPAHAAACRRPRSRARVDEALALVQLGGQGDKLPGQLSGGQQQRVAIARAIVIEPPLVLMDEPLSNLDAKLRLEMRAEIRRIHASSARATIYVTHDQDEALSLADRIVVMKDGVVQPDRHAGGALRAAGASRRRAIHGLSQPAPARAPSAPATACSVDDRRRALARHADRARSAAGDAVVAIRPDDLDAAAPTGRSPRRSRSSSIAAATSIAPAAPATAPSCTSAPSAGRRGARPCGSRAVRRACWSIRRSVVTDRAIEAPRRTPAAARAARAARPRRRDAAGRCRRCCSCCAVRLSVPLRPGAVVHAEGGRLARELPQVLLRSVPLRHDLARRCWLAVPATLINVVLVAAGRLAGAADARASGC